VHEALLSARPVLAVLPADDRAGARVSRAADADAVIATLFRQQAPELVKMARLFVVDRNAAEDLVQEAFIRLSRSLDRIHDDAKVVAYLRSIVLNLCRDHNRRGLVSMRHQSPADDLDPASVEDHLVGREDQQEVLEALRTLPVRQRDCLTLRYLLDLGIPEIADTLGLSPNSVKTHLQRGLAALERRLEGTR
jgi:RNA polymerase sigma-70 factor (ECF subfamily)